MEVNNETPAALLFDKITKIDNIEVKLKQHGGEIAEIKKILNDNELDRKVVALDGRLTKVEKKQEFILDEVKELHTDIRNVNSNCDKQRTQCMGAVAPISLVADLKNDLKRMEERIQIAYDTTRRETKEALDVSGKWTRWAFVLSMLACIVSSVSVLVCVNVLLHLPK